MTHFRKFTSPLQVISGAYSYIALIGFVFYTGGFYTDSEYFTWGPPVKFFGQEISSQFNFYGLHILIFFHQIVNNWVNSVVYPWIINNVQDPKNLIMEYSDTVSLFIINLFDIYSQLDVILIVNGFTSQISFVFTICLANMITSTYINRQYLRAKRDL